MSQEIQKKRGGNATQAIRMQPGSEIRMLQMSQKVQTAQQFVFARQCRP